MRDLSNEPINFGESYLDGKVVTSYHFELKRELFGLHDV
jgi:hypothetical protein